MNTGSLLALCFLGYVLIGFPLAVAVGRVLAKNSPAVTAGVTADAGAVETTGGAGQTPAAYAHPSRAWAAGTPSASSLKPGPGRKSHRAPTACRAERPAASSSLAGQTTTHK